MKRHPPTSCAVRSSHGYVLVMTLVLVVMAGSVLTVMAKRNIFDASDVLQAQSQLQTRWAAYSLSRAILPNADQFFETVLEQQDEKPKEPLTKVSFELSINQALCFITLMDEQAKANINHLLKTKGNPTQTALAIRSLGDQFKIQDMPVLQIKPYTWMELPTLAPLHTWDQVLEKVEPDKLYAIEENTKAIGDIITCWGDGKLNFHNAPIQVIQTVCHPLINRVQIAKLIAARKADPQITLSNALTTADVTKDQLEKITPLFTEKSSCYALSISITESRQSHHWLTIGQRQNSPQTQVKSAHKDQQNDKLNTAEFEW